MEMSSQLSHPLVEDNSQNANSNFHILLTYEVINAEMASQAVSNPAAGAISLFVGTTRDNFDGKKVTRLEYEAYQPMAKKEMARLCQQATTKWPSIISIAMFHRLGVVPISEASVVIAVSSPHRRDAIEACHDLIDELKAHVPIWKKEVYEDGSRWKENAEFTKTAQQLAEEAT